MSLQNNEDVNDSTIYDRLDNPRVGYTKPNQIPFEIQGTGKKIAKNSGYYVDNSGAIVF